jgi:hypothetical protein
MSGDQGPCLGLPGGPVVPDGGGEGEQALRYAGGHAEQAAAAVQFQVELAFEGVVARFDELADRGDAGPAARFAATGHELADPGRRESLNERRSAEYSRQQSEFRLNHADEADHKLGNDK